MVEAADSSEKLVSPYQASQRHISEDHSINIRQLYALPTLYLCVFLFIWEQSLVPITA
jgi:hypothetical protein